MYLTGFCCGWNPKGEEEDVENDEAGSVHSHGKFSAGISSVNWLNDYRKYRSHRWHVDYIKHRCTLSTGLIRCLLKTITGIKETHDYELVILPESLI